MNNRQLLRIKTRAGQRTRIANRIKEVRQLSNSKNKEDALFSLIQIGSNYPKLRRLKC